MGIVIIGGSEFIVTKLSLGFAKTKKLFHIIDKAPSGFFPEMVSKADIREPLSLTFSFQPVAFINLAAEIRDDVQPLSLYDQVNLDGSGHICDLACDKGVNKIIFTSSVAVYGFAPLGDWGIWCNCPI